MRIEEGYMPFMGYRTYYRIVGELSTDRKPLGTDGRSAPHVLR